MNTVVTGDIRRGAEERATLSTIFSFSAVIISFAAFFVFSLPAQAADISNSCEPPVPGNIDDTHVESNLGDREDEPSLAEVLTDLGYDIDPVADQQQTQIWSTGSSTSNKVRVTLLDAHADHTNTLYYHAIDLSVDPEHLEDVEPEISESLFTVEAASSTATSSPETESEEFTVADDSGIGFTIVSEGEDGQETWYTENFVNPNHEDHSLVYDLGNNSYIVAFEDEPVAGAIEDEPDYQDMVVLVEMIDTTCDTPDEPEEPTPSACFLPDALGDIDNEVINDSGEPTLNEILNETGTASDTFHEYNYGIDVTNDQKQFQLWQTGKSATLEVEVLLDDQFALYDNAFGYYTNGDIDTFSTTTDSTTGDTATVTVAASSSIGFAIEATTPSGETYRWTTENALNGGDDHVVVYQIADNEYIVAFEDEQNLGDRDYQDLVVRVKMTNCDNGGSDNNGGDDGDNNGGGDNGGNDDNGDNNGGDNGDDGIDVGSGGNHDSGSHHGSGNNDLRISHENAEQESLTSARITFDTNKRANCRVYYGTDSVDDPDQDDDNLNYEYSVSGGDDEEEHEVIIDHLEAGETYYFRPNCKTNNDEALGDEVNLDLQQGEVLGAASCSPFLTTYMKRGQANDLFEVMKLQAFLNTFEGENLVVSGTFDLATERAVNRFQMKYADEVLNLWGYADNQPTGYVYITTQTKINEIYCHREIPFTSLEQQEIDLYRQYQSLLAASPITVINPSSNGTVTITAPDEAISSDNNGTTTTDGIATTSSSTDEVSSSTGSRLAGNNFLEKTASAVYLAFNDIVNFLLAPCFLLLILGILLGLLVVELYKGRAED
jgi:hypothetical protein